MFSYVSNFPVQLHDFYESSTFLFIVFELWVIITTHYLVQSWNMKILRAKGGELFDYLSTHVTLSEKKIRQIMRQIFEAVCEMHSRRIVHRDLKVYCST